MMGWRCVSVNDTANLIVGRSEKGGTFEEALPVSILLVMLDRGTRRQDATSDGAPDSGLNLRRLVCLAALFAVEPTTMVRPGDG